MVLTLHFRWNTLEHVYRVNGNKISLQLVIERYRADLGFSSAVFFYRGFKLDPQLTIEQLNLEHDVVIIVNNPCFPDLSVNSAVEVHVNDIEGTYMGVRGYSIKPGTSCERLASFIKLQLNEKRPIHLFDGYHEVPASQILNNISTLVAIIG